MSAESAHPSPKALLDVKSMSADKLLKTAFGLFLPDLVQIVRPRTAARLDLENARFLPPEQLPDFSAEDEDRFAAELQLEENKEVHEMVDLWQEALDESKKEGESQGEARGELKATRKAIVLMASSCKCETPPDFADKLDAIDDLEKLFQILEQIPRIRSAAELDLG